MLQRFEKCLNSAIYFSSPFSSAIQSDQSILDILRLHEVNGCSLSEFKPLLWGQSAISHYSVTRNDSSISTLWKMPKVSEVLALIEPKKMIKSAVEFPLAQTLAARAEQIAENAGGMKFLKLNLRRFYTVCWSGLVS